MKHWDAEPEVFGHAVGLVYGDRIRWEDENDARLAVLRAKQRGAAA